MDNFNLRTFLTENKLTFNSRNIKLDEALNKELKAFGPDLQNRLKTLGLKAGVFQKQPDRDMFTRIQSDTSLAYIEYIVTNGHESIKIYSSKVNQDKVEKAMGYFNLDVTQYGPEKDAGWVLKNAINKNPGDIMRSKVGVSNGLANVSIYRFEKFNYKNVKTTDKATGKADYLATAAESNSRNEEAELNVTASAKTLNDIIYQLLDDGHIQPETADDLLNAVSNSPSDDVYEAGAERSPDNRKPENLKLDPDYDKGGKYYSEDGTKAFRIQPFKQNDIKYTKDQAIKQGKHIVGLEGGELKKFISDYMAAWEADKGDTAPGKTFK